MKLIDLKLAIKAVDDILMQIGIYPQSTVEYSKTGELVNEKKRTEWQDGWNAAVIKLGEKIGEQLDTLNNGVSDDLALLMIADVGWLKRKEFLLNMNDVFYYACSDFEAVSEEEIPEVSRLFREYGYSGLIYWVAKKRSCDPEIERYKKEVQDVRSKELK